MDRLKYLQENGCPLDDYACTGSSSRGYLECLKLAHKSGCPLHEIAILDAAYNDHFDCLKYLHENGCPYRESMLYSKDARCREYIKNNMRRRDTCSCCIQ